MPDEPNTQDLSEGVAELLDTVPESWSQFDAVTTVVASLAKSYTRGNGFTDGEPADDLRSVIMLASTRLLRDKGIAAESMGPFSVTYRGGFDGWTAGELMVLNRYRARAQ